MRTCELRHLALEHEYGPCGGKLNRHHIVSKGNLTKNKAGRYLVDKTYKFDEEEEPYPGMFLAWVCSHHDDQTRFAHTPVARDFLLQKRYNAYGQRFLDAVEELALTCTSPLDYLRPYLEMIDET